MHKLMGNIMYFEKSYKEALLYYEKAIQLGYDARLMANYFVCNYYTFKKMIPISIPKQFVDPMESYSAGADLNVFINSFKKGSSKYLASCEVQKIFYANAHTEFCAFYYNNAGNPKANNDHYFAMNCNNYGSVLGDLGEYEFSIPILQTGYQLSPFWEQLNTLSTAQYNASKYEDCIETINKMFIEYYNSIPLRYYVNYHRILIDCYKVTNQSTKAFEIIEKIEEEKEYLETEIFKQNDANEIWLDYNIILNQKAILLEEVKGLEYSISTMLKRLETEPDNSSIYFLLLQQYRTNNEYEKSIGCANNYFQLIRNISVENDDLRIYYYNRGSSLCLLKRYDEAILDLKNALKIEPTHYWTNHYLGLSYYYKNEFEKFKPIANYCINCYTENDFNWDADIEILTSHLLSVLKMENNKKEILQLVKFILSKDPENNEAKKYKKEFGSWFNF